MGQQYAMAYHEFRDCTLAAFVDPNEERTQLVCARFGCNYFATVGEMLTEIQPDIVAVVTPAKYFKEIVLEAAAHPAVKAIQCEKPFGR
eukprot:SAG31_NODE_3712_length_3957_cov_9.372041_1_plen_89_part_10